MQSKHALLLLPLALVLAAAAPRADQDPFRWSGEVPRGRSIEVRGIQGDIRAEPASGSQVEVVAHKRAGRRGDPGDVRLEVVRHEGGVTVCAVYPTPAGARANRCAPGGGGGQSVRDNDVRVDFTVRVPAGVRLVARNVSGDIETGALRSPVSARTVSGSVRLATSEWGEASTVSGDISAALGRAAWQDELDFRTVSGNISLELPSGADTEVRAETVSGRVSSDFALNEMRGYVHHRVRGTLGSGGRTLELKSVSGDIRLRRGR